MNNIVFDLKASYAKTEEISRQLSERFGRLRMHYSGQEPADEIALNNQIEELMEQYWDEVYVRLPHVAVDWEPRLLQISRERQL